MKMQVWSLTAQAWPSCLLTPNEAEQVKKISVTVERPFSQMGKVNRNKLHRAAWNELKKLAPRFHGCGMSIGGYTSGEPKLKDGATPPRVSPARGGASTGSNAVGCSPHCTEGAR
jgi:hypothetical protein